GLAHRREVVHAVPLRDELEIGRELRRGPSGKREIHGGEPLRDARFERHARFSRTDAAPPWRRLRCTRRREMAAGVTPWTRDACPTVSGRAWASFCRTSFESPRMAS